VADKIPAGVQLGRGQTLTYYRLPLPHHKHMKSTDEIDKPLRRDLLERHG